MYSLKDVHHKRTCIKNTIYRDKVFQMQKKREKRLKTLFCRKKNFATVFDDFPSFFCLLRCTFEDNMIMNIIMICSECENLCSRTIYAKDLIVKGFCLKLHRHIEDGSGQCQYRQEPRQLELFSN